MWQVRREAAFKPISPRIYHHYNTFLPASKAGRGHARQEVRRQTGSGRGLPQGVPLPLPSDDAEGTKNQGAAHGLPPDGRSAKRGCLERPRGLADARKAPGLVFLCSVPKQRPPHSGDKPRVFRALRRYARQSRCALRAQAEKRLALAEALVAECTGHAITPDAIVDRSSSVYSPRGGFVRGHRQIQHGPLSRAAPAEAGILRNGFYRTHRAGGQNGQSGHSAQSALRPRRMRVHVGFATRNGFPRRACRGAKRAKRAFSATGVMPSPHARPRRLTGRNGFHRPCRGPRVRAARWIPPRQALAARLFSHPAPGQTTGGAHFARLGCSRSPHTAA